jgi:hypothetical protein
MDYPVSPDQVWDAEHFRLRKPLERIILQDYSSNEWEEYIADLVREARHALRCCPSSKGHYLCIRKEGHLGNHEAFKGGPHTPRVFWTNLSSDSFGSW